MSILRPNTALQARVFGSGQVTMPAIPMSSWLALATCRLSKLSQQSRCCNYVPDIRIRVVNVVDLMVLEPQSEHPHGLSDRDFDEMFTTDRPVIFAFHGYPTLIHRLTYRRHNHDNFHVRGYKEEGTTTTPFDMVVLNNLDRYQLALDAISRIPRLSNDVEKATDRYWSTIERHKLYVSEHGEDMPEVADWRWSVQRS